MCYYNGNKVTKDEYIRLKHLVKWVAKYDFLNRDVINGFDFGTTAIIRPVEGKEDIEIVPMEWGFIPDPLRWPFWETRPQVATGRVPHKDPNGKFVEGLNFLNAISEEILYKNKVYRSAALARRCLFISSGFYDWRHIFPIGKRTGRPLKTPVVYPYRVMVKGKEYFFMAGVWQQWTDADTGETVDSCSMVTTAANGVMEQIHNTKKRMPTILNEELAWEWIFGKLEEKRIQEIAAYQIPWKELSYYTLQKNFLNAHDPTSAYEYKDLPPIITPDNPQGMREGQMELFS